LERIGDEVMKRSTIIIFVFLGFVISTAIWGCQGSTIIIGDEPQVREVPKKGPPPWAPAHGRRAKYQYHYYPDAYVYFDTGRRIYFYYQNNQWQFSASLPSGIRITVGEHVALEMDTDKPYQFHSDVVKSYPPGQLKKADKDKSKDKNKGKNK
jgi:hypothetical protein